MTWKSLNIFTVMLNTKQLEEFQTPSLFVRRGFLVIVKVAPIFMG